jgi:elongation factor P
MATTADIKNGLAIELEGQLFIISEFQHVKPGKGGAFVRTKLKNMITGRVIERTLRSGEKIEIARIEDRPMQYLYREGEDFVFMDQETFEQINISGAVVSDGWRFLKEAEVATVTFHQDKPIVVTLPFFINFKIMDCEPGVRGDTVSNVTKPAKLATGAVVQVPLFIEQGEIIRVDTRTGTYLERARD